MSTDLEKLKHIHGLREHMIRQLRPLYGQREAKSLAEALFFYLAKIQRTEFSIRPEKELPVLLIDKMLDALEQLKKEKPLQYVTGQAEFMGLTLRVDERVLIPRPETEELVAWIIEDHKVLPGLKILDIGTGSGCIAIALKKGLLSSEISALDISEEALAMAAMNARENLADIAFFAGDILDFKEVLPGQPYDIIVSNPPYVTKSDRSLMRKNVTGYEPSRALYVPDEDPLKYFRAVAGFSISRLKRQGKVYVEINERFGAQCMELFRERGFRDVKLRKDLSGRDRMVRASW